MTEINSSLLNLVIQETPAVIAFIKDVFTRQNQDMKPPTDAEVIAAFESAFKSSLAKDDAWLSMHPKRD